MTDMILLYGKYNRRPRIATRAYALTYPERKHPDHVFFMRLESRLRKFGQFKPVKRPGRTPRITKRRSELLTDGLSVGQYMAQYPALDNAKGYTLLEIDFEKRNPDKVLKLFVNWPKLSDFLFEKLNNKIKDFSSNIVSEGMYVRTLKILSSISHLFACVNARKQIKEIKEWRPSKIEVQESFILHVKIIGDLEVQLRSRQEKLAQHCCDLQPLVAIVGPELPEIHQSFVVLGVRKYFEVDTPLKAIDVCFKVFHALHIQYPPECAQIWQFIQRAAYDMPRNRQYDPHYSSVEILLKEFSSYRSNTP
ncbi:uncharacterized protein [Temnothorax nylanderi]|uniref:uncharacterized protein n=1 Tax=Temnothorax nylanderi TaxID=102681 RepID=UPI003A858E4F